MAHNGLEYTSHKVKVFCSNFLFILLLRTLKKKHLKNNLAYYIFSHDLGAIILV